MMIGKNTESRHILPLIKSGTVGAEIGVWMGESTELFVKQKLKKLYIVDPWSVEPYEGQESWDYYIDRYSKIVGSKNPEDFQKYYDNVYQKVYDKYKIYPNCEIRRELSSTFYESLTEKLDWIYIDGDHSYEGAYYDFEMALSVVKPGGIIIGDDYGNKKDVVRAVDDWAKKYNKELHRYGKNQVVAYV